MFFLIIVIVWNSIMINVKFYLFFICKMGNIVEKKILINMLDEIKVKIYGFIIYFICIFFILF